MEDHRVSVNTKNVEIVLFNGSRLTGEIFLQLHSSKSYEPQKIEEILNGEDTFIPLRSHDRTDLINLKHIVALTCASENEENDLLKLGEHYIVTVETVHTKFENINVFVNLPTGQKRIKDFLNQEKMFLYFSSADKNIYLQRDMIVSVSD